MSRKQFIQDRPVLHAALALRRLLAMGALSVVLVACFERAPTVHAKLSISAAGVFTLDGVVVEAVNMKEALLAKRPKNGAFFVSIHVSPEAKLTAVVAAMEAAKLAEASVGLVGNEQF